MAGTTPQQYLTLADAAAQYGLSKKTIRRRIADGELAAFRIGPRAIRVNAADLAKLARPVPTVGDCRGPAA